MSTHTIRPNYSSTPRTRTKAKHPTVEITYDYSRGSPAFTPRGEYGPIDPPEPPGLEFRAAKTSSRVLEIDDDPAKLQKLAEEWLMGDGYDYACDCAETDLLATRAAHMEHRREQ